MELAERKNSYYLELLQKMDKGATLEGVYDVLSDLKKKNLLLSVGSASKNAPMILDKTILSPYLNQVSCGLDSIFPLATPSVARFAGLFSHLSARYTLRRPLKSLPQSLLQCSLHNSRHQTNAR